MLFDCRLQLADHRYKIELPARQLGVQTLLSSVLIESGPLLDSLPLDENKAIQTE
jgi:hypothetical protein